MFRRLRPLPLWIVQHNEVVVFLQRVKCPPLSRKTAPKQVYVGQPVHFTHTSSRRILHAYM